MSGSEILCVGEVLWDSLPAGLFLGGAPLNVACHLHALGMPVAMVSRVGADRLGEEAIHRMAHRGLSTDLIQVDRELKTGFVKIELDEGGVPEYEIVRPVAWDAIELSDTLVQRAAGARMIVFGCLAQRNEVTRSTIGRLCEADALKVFDVNLRPPYDDREIVRESLHHADVVKLNEDELAQLGPWFGLPAGLQESVGALAETFDCGMICITRGGSGSALWRDGRWTEHPGFRVEVRDTVGAGDAFLAGLLAGVLQGKDDLALLQHANLMGAYVATRDGAVPPYEEDAMVFIARVCGQGVAPRAASTRGQAFTGA